MEDEDSDTAVREDPHSLSPVQLETASIDQDLAQIKRGRSARLFATALLSGLAAFGVAKWMENIDGSQAYAAAAERVEAINAQQGTALLRCMLPDLQRSQLEDQSALHTALEVASERGGKAYGKQLERCEPLSEDLSLRVDALNVPTDMAPRLTTLRSYANEVDQALAVYRKYLQDPSRPYDFVQATPLIERVAIAWTVYEQQRAKLNQALRAHQ
jgi:F0F1-type ATP synthase membrane subunit c/vacuolar-type H+-ATPase subunit K